MSSSGGGEDGIARVGDGDGARDRLSIVAVRNRICAHAYRYLYLMHGNDVSLRITVHVLFGVFRDAIPASSGYSFFAQTSNRLTYRINELRSSNIEGQKKWHVIGLM